MKLTIVAGARPNFIKIAPLIHSLLKNKKHEISFRLVHTGQHYDKQLSEIFFEELNIPPPHSNLEVGSGTQAFQTGQIMIKFEEELTSYRPDFVIVVGDVNSTLACSIVTKKLNIGLIHIEAGIRSFDMTMPEEINRIVTDSLTDIYFTTSEFANKNLIRFGARLDQIHFVGNIMIDSLKANESKFSESKVWIDNELSKKKYWVATLHRPSNVDQIDNLLNILRSLDEHSGGNPVVFPIHPRTNNILKASQQQFVNIISVPPQSYHHFMHLVKNSIGVVTDSGGIQEETTILKIPCITLRKNTERPETVSIGTNELALDLTQLSLYMKAILEGKWKKGNIPELWDGKTADRIVDILLNKYRSL